MNTKHNASLTRNAQTLRRRMTKEEKHLWYDGLKYLPITVQRQKVIGPYIVDFYIASVNVVIEVDGSQHWDIVHRQKDEVRDTYFSQQGITVLRYSNEMIHTSFRDVCDDIWNVICEKTESISSNIAEKDM